MKCIVLLVFATLVAFSAGEFRRVPSTFKDGIKWEITSDAVHDTTLGRSHVGAVAAHPGKQGVATTFEKPPSVGTFQKVVPQVQRAHGIQPKPTTPRNRGIYVHTTPKVFKKQGRTTVSPYSKQGLPKYVQTRQKNLQKQQHYSVRH